MNSLLQITAKLRDSIKLLNVTSSDIYFYNPLDYASIPHAMYLDKFGKGQKKVLLMGMNPGPFGMAQTGVPFGDIVMVKEWLGIEGHVGKPDFELPNRPVDGFSCLRREGSGKRLWGWAKDEFISADNFFKDFFVINYCPLIFFNKDGNNITPDKLPKQIQTELHNICDKAISDSISLLKPQYAIGIGNYATERLRKIIFDEKIVIDSIIHPSPANPMANRGWSEQVNKKFFEIGIFADNK